MKKLILLLLLSGSLNFKVYSQVKWWNNVTAYEVFVRSFYDSNGDGIGDFNGLNQKLSYLNDGLANNKEDLGIGLVWLMPINASPSYHGYDVTNYLTLNPQFGSLNEFKDLLNQAHSRGIKVIMDFVMNHSSNQHPWFIKSAANDSFYRNFYRWNTSPPSGTGPWGQQIWHPKNGSNYYALFWSGMPDLNYEYKPVKDSLFAAAKYWLKDIGVDGFRLDAAMYIYEEGTVLKNHPKTIEFWREFNDSCKSWNHSSLLIGEVWDTPQTLALYKGALDMCFDFGLSDATMYGIKSGNANSIRLAMEDGKQIFDTNQYGGFLTNHDQNRVFDIFSGNLGMMKAAASAMLTQGGVPFVYYGEEIGMKGAKPDENIRRPMQWNNGTNAGFSTGNPWRALNSNYTNYNVSTEKADPNSLWNHYRKLIEVRNENLSLQKGNHSNLITTHTEVLSYYRSLESEVIVLVNPTGLMKTDIQFNWVPSNLTKGSNLVVDLLNDSSFSVIPKQDYYPIKINLGPYQSRVLKLRFAILEGIGENGWANSIQLYPNPARNLVHINRLQNQSDLAFELYNLQGELVQTEKIEGSQNEVKLMVASGIYLVKLSDLSGQVSYKKLLVD
ncbi:MAG: alpha-amylase family glycosyl hydrolase [bacterium]|nr:alpha-amylase family glycosyl hydrolase [bacterium]